MTDVEAAWVGALVEGEGHVGAMKGRYWQITVGNTDVEVISTLLRLTEIGRVRFDFGLVNRRPQNRQMWYWSVSKTADVLALATVLSPYCIKVRRIKDRYHDSQSY